MTEIVLRSLSSWPATVYAVYIYF